jgi:hypothetical protein
VWKTKELKKRLGKRKSSRLFWKPSPVRALLSARNSTTLRASPPNIHTASDRHVCWTVELQGASVHVKLLEAVCVAGGFAMVSVLISSLLKDLDEEYEEFWDTDAQDQRTPPSSKPPASTPVDLAQQGANSVRRRAAATEARQDTAAPLHTPIQSLAPPRSADGGARAPSIGSMEVAVGGGVLWTRREEPSDDAHERSAPRRRRRNGAEATDGGAGGLNGDGGGDGGGGVLWRRRDEIETEEEDPPAGEKLSIPATQPNGVAAAASSANGTMAEEEQEGEGEVQSDDAGDDAKGVKDVLDAEELAAEEEKPAARSVEKRMRRGRLEALPTKAKLAAENLEEIRFPTRRA